MRNITIVSVAWILALAAMDLIEKHNKQEYPVDWYPNNAITIKNTIDGRDFSAKTWKDEKGIVHVLSFIDDDLVEVDTHQYFTPIRRTQ